MAYSYRYGNIKVENDQGLTRMLTSYKVTWGIQYFHNSSRNFGEYDESPHFFLGANKQYEWTLNLFMAGLSRNTRDYVAVRAFIFNAEHHKNTHFLAKCSLLCKDGQIYVDKLVEINSIGSGIIEKFVSKNNLLMNRTALLPNDELTIACEIFHFSDSDRNLDESAMQFQLAANKPLESFKKLMDNKKFSDFRLIVKKKEFHVHRAILAAQSPVFEAMFDIKMRDAKEGKVNIEDIELKVMEKMLHFFYNGNVDLGDLGDKVLIAAEKYQIDQLKHLCEHDLAKQLNLTTVYEFLVLADQNNASYLKKQAIEFFDKNLKVLCRKDTFKKSINSLPRNLLVNIIQDYAMKR